ncbi:MAG: PD40 domain-containing protein [Candidatus Eisenbacteria sp.]|nr:PD40 domain-containing protein [Candidatus Eisenbacteria bacterium]
MEHGCCRWGRPSGRAGAGVAGRILLLGLALLVALGSSLAGAQYIRFGKNKVNYRSFDWSLLKSDHFDLYYYPEEEELAQIALAMAEDSYGRHRERFVHEVADRIPVILYSSHHDFEQTNITPLLIPEGVLGLTESLHGRVLMPFDGSLYSFARTLEHELVHVFQLSISEEVYDQRLQRRTATPPLWFTEGLADYWSGEWDPDGDMVLRDLVISGRLPGVDQIWRYNYTFTLYKLGQSLVEFIATTYGEDKLVHFYTDAWKLRAFDQLYLEILGVTAEELNAGWRQWLRRRYYPEVLDREPLLHAVDRVGVWPHELKPTPAPDSLEGISGNYVFISPQDGYVSIYSAPLVEGGGDGEVLIKGQRSSEFLSFHGVRSRMDISGAGRLVFSSHAGERDCLVVYDLAEREVVGRWGFADLVSLTSPQWDRAGERILFSGLRRDGHRDIYVIDTASGARTQLTDDRFCDREPAFHPDGERIAFVSDRGPAGRRGARNLFLLDLPSGELRALSTGAWWDAAPSWSPDGSELLFVSTRAGGRDLYTLSLDGRGARRTHALEAILDPRWMPSGDGVLATLYAEGRMETVRIPLTAPSAADSFHTSLEPVLAESGRETGEWERVLPEVKGSRDVYRPTFALDAAQGGVAVDPGLGSGEGLQVLLRDLMGNRLVFIQMGNTTISTRNFLDNFSAGVTYVDLSRRLNRGLSIFHHAGTYYDERSVPYFDRRVGASALLSYPLSRFTRLESSIGLAYAEKEKLSADLTRRGAIATHYFSWIHDTSLWLPTGPIDGDRCHLTVGLTMNLRRPGVENVLLLADARRYFRLGRQSALAARLQVRASGGPDPQVFSLGGSHSLRGYRWRDFYGTRAAMANVEWRFPLLRRFLLDPVLLGPLAFPGVQGALFFDAGEAWYHDWPAEWRGSYGLGLRMGLAGVLVLRLDIARLTNFEHWPSERSTEFFVGWNY